MSRMLKSRSSNLFLKIIRKNKISDVWSRGFLLDQKELIDIHLVRASWREQADPIHLLININNQLQTPLSQKGALVTGDGKSTGNGFPEVGSMWPMMSALLPSAFISFYHCFNLPLFEPFGFLPSCYIELSLSLWKVVQAGAAVALVVPCGFDSSWLGPVFFV